MSSKKRRDRTSDDKAQTAIGPFPAAPGRRKGSRTQSEGAVLPAGSLAELPVQAPPVEDIAPPVAAAPASAPGPAPASHLQALASVIEIKHSLRELKNLTRLVGEQVQLWQSNLNQDSPGLGSSSLGDLGGWRGELDQLQYDPIDEPQEYKARLTNYTDAFLADVGSYLWTRYLAIFPPLEAAVSQGRKSFLGRLDFNEEATLRFGQNRDQMKALISRINDLSPTARDELRRFLSKK